MVNPRSYIGRSEASRKEALSGMIGTARALSIAGATGLLLAIAIIIGGSFW